MEVWFWYEDYNVKTLGFYWRQLFIWDVEQTTPQTHFECKTLQIHFARIQTSVSARAHTLEKSFLTQSKLELGCPMSMDTSSATQCLFFCKSSLFARLFVCLQNTDFPHFPLFFKFLPCCKLLHDGRVLNAKIFHLSPVAHGNLRSSCSAGEDIHTCFLQSSL